MTGFLFFSSFLYYLAGLSGTVPAYRDSGDLIASIDSLGIAHPPGYALYVLIGKLVVTLLPFGNVSYRVNVMSALFASGAVVVLYRVLVKVTQEKSVVPLILSGLLVVSPAMTALARVAEMYTLSALLTALVVLCLLSEDPRGPSWAALFLGLGLSVHLTLVFLVPLFLIAPSRTITRRSALFFLLGLSIFLYLPLRAAQDPVLNWGDPSHWRNFWRVVTRADYGGLKLHPQESVLAWTPAQIFRQSQYFLTTFSRDWGWGGLFWGVVGVVVTMRRDSKRQAWAWGVLSAWLLAGPAFFVLSNLPLEAASTPAILQPYVILPLVLWSLFTAIGIHAAITRTNHKRWMTMACAVLLLGTKSWAWPNTRHDFYAYDYARNLLRILPQDAVLYDPDDTTHFSIQVLQLLEDRRRDVVLLSFFRTRWGYEQIKRRWPDLLPPIPMRSGDELQKALWDYAARRRPFFAELPQKFEGRPYRSYGLLYSPTGLSSREFNATASRRQSRLLLETMLCRGRCVTTSHQDFFTKHLLGYYAAARSNLGLEYASAKDWPEAVRYYQAALEIDPELSAAWNNWGIADFEQRDYAAAAKRFQRALNFEPKNELFQKNLHLAQEHQGQRGSQTGERVMSR